MVLYAVTESRGVAFGDFSLGEERLGVWVL